MNVQPMPVPGPNRRSAVMPVQRAVCDAGRHKLFPVFWEEFDVILNLRKLASLYWDTMFYPPIYEITFQNNRPRHSVIDIRLGVCWALHLG